jgi:2-hydroxychromene-2-carboxylate isomerase
MIATAAVVTAALAAGSGAAVAATAGGKPAGPAKTMSAGGKPGGSKSAGERQGHDAMTAAVARALHVSTARAGAALRPLFAAGRADTSSPAFAAAARSLGVSTQQLNTALVHAKLSLIASMHIKQRPSGAKSAAAKSAGSNSAAERQGHDAMTAAVARALHVATARAGAALRPLFAAGRADTSSPAFAAAARSLGVSTQQLNTALVHAKLSLAAGT